MEQEDKNTQNGQNSGQVKTIINIGTAYNVNPAATEVKNTFIIGSGKEASAAIKEAVGGGNLNPSLYDRLKEPEATIDITPIRTEILNYVSCIRPLVAPDKKDRYMKMWEGILELDAVKPFVYKTGKQKETNFNRKLIANIIHHLDSRKMYAKPYKASDFAKALEGDSEKSVRGELGKFPSDHVCAEIDNYLESQNLWHKA